MKIGIIGEGAIAGYVGAHLEETGAALRAVLVRPARLDGAGAPRVASVADLPEGLDLMVDCAGHAALAEHGPAILERGIDLVTVSLGALADRALHDRLEAAAKAGGARQEAKTPNPCASYGPGFKMLPGTTTCVRIGGAVVGDFGAGSPAPNLGVK